MAKRFIPKTNTRLDGPRRLQDIGWRLLFRGPNLSLNATVAENPGSAKPQVGQAGDLSSGSLFVVPT